MIMIIPIVELLWLRSTWLYDRAGWSPGTFGTTYDHEITLFISS